MIYTFLSEKEINYLELVY
jgi:hypothetical protein